MSAPADPVRRSGRPATADQDANAGAPLAAAAACLAGQGQRDPGNPVVAVTAWAGGGMLTIRPRGDGPDVDDSAHPGAARGLATARLDAGQMGIVAGLVGAEQIAVYARACLAAVRPERDWYRLAFAKLEAAGEQIVQTEQPSRDGGAWLVLDWRTGRVLARIEGGQDAYEAAWQGSWTDVSWVGSWLEDLTTDGTPAPDWPEALPPPPDVAELTAAPPPLALPGLPAGLRVRLEEAIDAWVTAAASTEGRTAEVARLTGWTEDQVLACTGSYIAMTGEQYMHVASAAGAQAGEVGYAALNGS